MSRAQMSYREAIVLAQRQCMLDDERVVVMGEDIGAAGGPFKTTAGLFAEFGERRVRDTPISEQAFVGAAMGMAMTGYRPIVELMFADFMAVCYDQIANSIAKHRFMQGGTLNLPLVIRTLGGGGIRFGAQHSQTGESWLLSLPGLRVVCASSPHEAFHLIRAAVRDPNPVVVIEHKALLNTQGEIDFSDDLGIDQPRRLTHGDDITIVASLAMVDRCRDAVDALARDGVAAELFDLRTIRPLPLDAIMESVRRTNRLLCVEENHSAGGWGGEVVSAVVANAFDFLDAPPGRLTLPDHPMPYSPALEDTTIPSIERIRGAALDVIAGRAVHGGGRA